MKKLTLFAVTALTAATLCSNTLTAQAASGRYCQVIPGAGKVIYFGGSGCDFQSILDKLENCLPGITLPDNNTPDSNKPETNLPENNPGNGTTEDTLPEEDTDNSQHAFLKEIVSLVNAERAKEGLSPLTLDTKVQAAAQVRAKESELLFSHTRPNGSSFSTALKEQNVSFKGAGENIAWGQKTPAAVMKAWMNSSGHRANIMNPNFTTIGVGYYVNATGTPYWCQLFTR